MHELVLLVERHVRLFGLLNCKLGSLVYTTALNISILLGPEDFYHSTFAHRFPLINLYHEVSNLSV